MGFRGRWIEGQGRAISLTGSHKLAAISLQKTQRIPDRKLTRAYF
jgi:hypothetical protein